MPRYALRQNTRRNRNIQRTTVALPPPPRKILPRAFIIVSYGGCYEQRILQYLRKLGHFAQITHNPRFVIPARLKSTEYNITVIFLYRPPVNALLMPNIWGPIHCHNLKMPPENFNLMKVYLGNDRKEKVHNYLENGQDLLNLEDFVNYYNTLIPDRYDLVQIQVHRALPSQIREILKLEVDIPNFPVTNTINSQLYATIERKMSLNPPISCRLGNF